MFISATNYLWATLATAAFGLIYEHFSHGVTSYLMLLAFLFPLLGGAALCLLPLLRAPRPRPGARSLYGCGILTLTVGSLVQGALNIYGTTNRLCTLYWLAGGSLLILAVGSYLRSLRRQLH